MPSTSNQVHTLQSYLRYDYVKLMSLLNHDKIVNGFDFICLKFAILVNVWVMIFDDAVRLVHELINYTIDLFFGKILHSRTISSSTVPVRIKFISFFLSIYVFGFIVDCIKTQL